MGAAGNAVHGLAAEAVDLVQDPPTEASIWKKTERAERLVEASLLHDIFGNPFCPSVVERSWLTAAVVTLAAHVYYERAFDQMPRLADALLDAGCDDEELKEHCRSGGPHVRGCWAIDLLLGKS
jgi:hypothetical protein